MTDSMLAEVLADLSTEAGLLDDLVAPLDEPGWRRPTPAAGWDVATQVAHLAWTDEVAVMAAIAPDAWQVVLEEAAQDIEGFNDACAADGARAPGAEILERWRRSRRRLAETLTSLPEGTRISWFGPPMSATSMATARFMETWAHGLDVADALGVALEPTDRVRHVVHIGVRARDFAFSLHDLEPPAVPFRVELRAPGRELTYGPEDAEQSVRGSAYDFALLVTQRRHRDDLVLEARGADAETWLDIAQAFAGPPGTGRQPVSASMAGTAGEAADDR